MFTAPLLLIGGGRSDPFADFFNFGFGGFGGGGGRQNSDTPRGEDVLLKITVTLEELYSGNFVDVCVLIKVFFLLDNVSNHFCRTKSA